MTHLEPAESIIRTDRWQDDDKNKDRKRRRLNGTRKNYPPGVDTDDKHYLLQDRLTRNTCIHVDRW